MLLPQAVCFIGGNSSSRWNGPALLWFGQYVTKIAGMSAQRSLSLFTCLHLLYSQEGLRCGSSIRQWSKLPELLLLVVTHQTAKLREMCSGISQVVQRNRAAGARALQLTTSTSSSRMIRPL